MAFVLQLFGGFRLVGADGMPVVLPDRARALLAYLAVASSPVPRQALAELLSAEGNEQEQRTTLRQAVYVARKAMADSAVICTQETDLALNDALVSADVRHFQSAIACGDDRSLAEAVEIYRGPFLEAEKSPSSAFEEWLGARRADFLEHMLAALLKLAGAAAAAGRHDSALEYARRAVTLDPLREDGHRQVMRSRAAMASDRARCVSTRSCGKRWRRSSAWRRRLKRRRCAMPSRAARCTNRAAVPLQFRRPTATWPAAPTRRNKRAQQRPAGSAGPQFGLGARGRHWLRCRLSRRVLACSGTSRAHRPHPRAPPQSARSGSPPFWFCRSRT
jgi:DNA-binding SARP family transcriptional activator